ITLHPASLDPPSFLRSIACKTSITNHADEGDNAKKERVWLSRSCTNVLFGTIATETRRPRYVRLSLNLGHDFAARQTLKRARKRLRGIYTRLVSGQRVARPARATFARPAR